MCGKQNRNIFVAIALLMALTLSACQTTALPENDPQAFYDLAVAYEKGEDRPKDPQQAIEYFRKAAELGHAKAQAVLGGKIAAGQNVSQDDDEALKWINKSAEQDFPGAFVLLGVMHAKGQILPKSDEKAINWYKKAAELGDLTGQRNLAYMYKYGRGAPKDYEAAIEMETASLKAKPPPLTGFGGPQNKAILRLRIF